MIALIDTDILLYEVGSYTNDEGHPLSWPLCKSRADAKIQKIVEAAGCDDYRLFLTGDNNFRIREGTIKPYKGHRVSPKPPNHANLKKYFTESKNFEGKVTLTDGYEADDALSIKQYLDIANKVDDLDPYNAEVLEICGIKLSTVLCSRDKDLNMVPGWHYSWGSGKQKEKEPWFITEDEGNHWFFTQLLTGDSTDNIPGLYRVGKVAAKKLLDGLTEPLSLYTVVQHEYEVRFGSYWKLFMHENARLLWMMRSEDDDIREWLDALEEQRLDTLVEAEEF
jgi:hypothetical protein